MMQANKYKIITLLSLAAILFLVPVAFAHCDTLDGPVIQAAKEALETGDVNSALIWVKKDDEAQIREAFEKTLAARKLTSGARDLADTYFFETLVRLHRAGEGAPYTGLKPAGTEVDAGVAAADKAIKDATIDNLAREMSAALNKGLLERFNRVMEKKKLIKQSIEAGREYVAAYVEFIHYVEKLHQDIAGEDSHK